jgi:hypothetical protein
VTDATRTDDEPDRPTRGIVVASCLVFAEAATLVGLAVVELFQLDGGRLALGVTNAVFFLLYAAGLAFCARGLLRLSRWTRGPLVMAQLIQLGVAYSFYGHDTEWLAVILAATAIAVLAVMFAPSTTALLYGSSRLFEDDLDEQRAERDEKA